MSSTSPKSDNAITSTASPSGADARPASPTPDMSPAMPIPDTPPASSCTNGPFTPSDSPNPADTPPGPPNTDKTTPPPASLSSEMPPVPAAIDDVTVLPPTPTTPNPDTRIMKPDQSPSGPHGQRSRPSTIRDLIAILERMNTHFKEGPQEKSQTKENKQPSPSRPQRPTRKRRTSLPSPPPKSPSAPPVERESIPALPQTLAASPKLPFASSVPPPTLSMRGTPPPGDSFKLSGPSRSLPFDHPYPRLKETTIASILNHTFDHIDLGELDPRSDTTQKAKKVFLVLGGSINVVPNFRDLPSLIVPLMVYFKILVHHAPARSGATIAAYFFEYTAQLHKLAAVYQWSAVVKYHLEFSSRRCGEMRTVGSYERWATLDPELAEKHLYLHWKTKTTKPPRRRSSKGPDICRKFNRGMCDVECPWGRAHLCSTCQKGGHNATTHAQVTNASRVGCVWQDMEGNDHI